MGFGDITPKTDVARILVSVQMLLDLVIIGVVVRLLITVHDPALVNESKIRQISHKHKDVKPMNLSAFSNPIRRGLTSGGV